MTTTERRWRKRAPQVREGESKVVQGIGHFWQVLDEYGEILSLCWSEREADRLLAAFVAETQLAEERERREAAERALMQMKERESANGCPSQWALLEPDSLCEEPLGHDGPHKARVWLRGPEYGVDYVREWLWPKEAEIKQTEREWDEAVHRAEQAEARLAEALRLGKELARELGHLSDYVPRDGLAKEVLKAFHDFEAQEA